MRLFERVDKERNKSQIAAIQALILANQERLARIRAAMASVDAHLQSTAEQFSTGNSTGHEPPRNG